MAENDEGIASDSTGSSHDENVEVEDDQNVKLVSQEGEAFVVPLSAAKLSELVKTMIDDESDKDEEQEIPLPNVKATILAKVIEFAKYHASDPMRELEKVIDCTFASSNK